MKFHIPTENIHLEGTMCQIFDIGLGFYFMKSRKIIMKNNKNLPFFGHKNKLKPILRFLRHSSLRMNVMSMLVNFQNDKQEILEQKLEVRK